MTLRLRAHHLLCALTYVGEGYSAAFVANFDAIASRLATGEPARLVAGPDDICAALRGTADTHCGEPDADARDGLAAEAIGRALGQPVAADAHITLEAPVLTTLRRSFRSGRIRAACAGCSWSTLCDAVAARDFAGARLRLAEPAQVS